MKVFRKLTVLVLALALIAAMGIAASASTPSFTDVVNGDFFAFAVFSGNLTSNTISATADFHDNGGDNELQNHQIQIAFTAYDAGTGKSYGDNYARNGESVIYTYQLILPKPGYFTTATCCYNTTYIANGAVFCSIPHGPKVLTR